MNQLDREVVRDLLPLVVAGEASGASSALVEEALERDPELAREADRMRRFGELLGRSEASEPTADAEALALSRTKRMLRTRQLLLAAAIFFLMIPLSLRFDDGDVVWFVWRDYPLVGAASLAAAAILWIAFGILSRRLSVAGL